MAGKDSTWEHWRRKYAATSPVASFNKLSQWKISRDALDRVLRGNPEVLTRDVYPNFLYVSDLDRFPVGIAREIAPHALPLNDTVNILRLLKPRKAHMQRLKALRESVSRLIAENMPNSLLVVLAGGEHAIDYHAHFSRQKILYASTPLTDGATFRADELDQFLRVGARILGEEFFGVPQRELTHIAAIVIGGDLQYFLRNRRRLNIDAKAVLEDDETISHCSTIILATIHGLNETAIINDLPGSASLRSLGYTSITIAFEGVSAGRNYSREEMFRVNMYVNEDESFGGLKKLRHLIRQYPELFALWASGKMTKNPEWAALLFKGWEYQKAGMLVRYTGLEL